MEDIVYISNRGPVKTMNAENAQKKDCFKDPIVISAILFLGVTIGSIILITPLTGAIYHVLDNWENAVPFMVFGSLTSIIYSITWNERNPKKDDIRRSIWKYYLGLMLLFIVGAWINPDIVELNKNDHYSKYYNQTYLINKNIRISKSSSSVYLEFQYDVNPVDVKNMEGLLLKGTPIKIIKITRDNSTYRHSVEFIAEIENKYISNKLRLSDVVYDTETGDFDTKFLRRAKEMDKENTDYNPYDQKIIDEYNKIFINK